jgi:hypothetical protein
MNALPASMASKAPHVIQNTGARQAPSGGCGTLAVLASAAVAGSGSGAGG